MCYTKLTASSDHSAATCGVKMLYRTSFVRIEAECSSTVCSSLEEIIKLHTENHNKKFCRLRNLKFSYLYKFR